MIEYKEHPKVSGKAIFLDGKLLRYQILEPPTFTKEVIIVKCLTDDEHLPYSPSKVVEHIPENKEEWDNVPYQITPRVIVKVVNDVEYSIFFFDSKKLKP